MLNYRPPIWRHLLHHVLPSLLVNGVAPFVVYTLLHTHISQLHALMVTALVPLADGVVGLVRQRRINAFGALVFLSLVLSSLLVLVGGSPRLILVRESALSGVFGVLMLLSLFWPQPGGLSGIRWLRFCRPHGRRRTAWSILPQQTDDAGTERRRTPSLSAWSN